MCCGGPVKNNHDDGKDCCFGHEVVKDRMCCKFTLQNASTTDPANIAQDIYVNSTGQCVVASGTISLGCSLSPGLVATIIFLRGDTPVDTVNLGEESCVSFTATGFTRIRVFIAGFAPGGRVSGKICITPRYQLHV